VWAGPVSNWIAACDRILAMDIEVIVPGHGPLAGKDDVREQRAYFEYLLTRAGSLLDEGLTPVEAARTLVLDRWASWGDRERVAVNIGAAMRELAGDTSPANPLEAFAAMAELAP
jgi:glyoxylase-like metal-dependent hydrolase (beta-lactamase superfamily II)